jgi:hypothetical protein
MVTMIPRISIHRARRVVVAIVIAGGAFVPTQ